MATETEMLVESTLREDRSVGPVEHRLHLRQSALGRALRHQGIYGTEFRRISLSDPKRHGLLGQASILTVTSYPNRRADDPRKWVLEQIMGTRRPAAPNVSSLKEDATTSR